MGCRKNQATLTPQERQAYVNAVLQLKNQVPSQMGLASRYDDFVQIHIDSMMAFPNWAHQGPAFLPWHREYLRRFEEELQAIDPTVSLPYWDWTVNNSTDPAAPGSPWTNNFMGGNGDASGIVTTGPFAFSSGNWTLNVHDPDRPSPHPELRRRFGTFLSGGSPVSALPTAIQVTNCLAEIPYDNAPWNTNVSPSFRDRLEGWHGLGSIHNRVHLWVGGGANTSQWGTMVWSDSPNDPIFWLHHCNIDRLWTEWQRQHPAEGYHPTGVGAEVGPVGHNLTNAMQPWGGMTTPASTLDHHAIGYWYDTDPADVNLVTPSLSFIDIPEGIGGTGVTTYRAVLFEVLTCDPVTFEITAGPTPPFGAPLGLVTSVPPSTTDAPAIGRVWISYTSTTAGVNATGSVTIRCVETNETWVINIAANTVARPKSAVVLVLDRSGSMSEDAGDGHPKIEKLREAVQIFVGAMLDGDGLGIVRFDHEINRLLDVTNVGPMPPIPGSGRAQAIDILMSHDPATTLDPRGATSIGGGVAEGKLTLDTAPPTVPPYSVQAMVVLTDGVENTPPMIANVASSINAHTFAIGLGTPANISTAALNALTQNNNGYLLVTGTITPDQTFRLTKYFLQVLAGINNASVVLDPQGDLVYGAVHRIPFLVTEADMGIDVFLLSPAPYLIDFMLETPDGQTLDPGRAAAEPTAQFIVTPRASYYRISLPALPATPGGSHAGRWHAVLTLGRRTPGINAEVLHELRQRALPYNLLVHAYSNLHFQATLHQTSYEPGAQVVLRATLREYDVVFDRRARVWAEVTRPDGVQSTVTLTPQSGGLYEGSFHTTLPGIYPLRVRAAGQTFYGRPFQREQTLTATVFPGGDRPGRDPGLDTLIDWLAERDERFCHLIDCLLHDAGKVWLKRLAESGVDVERLVACLKEFCDRKPRGPQEATVAKATARPPQLATQTDLRRALANLESARAFAATFDFAELQHGEPIRREEPHDHHAVPMFDLSPEDKAAGEQPHHEPAPPAEPAQPEREQEAEPPPPFDLSPEDKGEEQPKRRRRKR